MPKQKDLKRLVRVRSKKAGESYTTARAQLLKKNHPNTDDRIPEDRYAALAGMSDTAVRAKTGRSWKQWVRALDAVDAMKLPHRDIARHVREEHDVQGWWAQTVTVGYERIRGLREHGQRRGGGYEANKSKTFPVAIAKLYRAFSTARTRNKWLPDARLEVRKSTREKSIRMTWEDGTKVEAYFTAKNASKSQVAIQHRDLPSKASATKMKEYWGGRLGALAEHLLSSPVHPK